MTLYASITEPIGDTPLVALQRIGAGLPGRLFVKVEFFNPLSSVKDRIGLAMVRDAEERGRLLPGGRICAARGYRLTLTMPDNASTERRKLLLHLGARVELTPANRGMMGAVDRARAILREEPGSVMLQQFENPANPAAHEATTGPEIWTDLQGQVDCFVAGVGTGGTLTGVSRFLRRHNPSLRVVAVEPDKCAVLSGKPPGPHAIEGIGAGFVPANLDRSLVDEVATVKAEQAFAAARRLAREEGILGGISSGANLHAALAVAARPEMAGKNIVTVVCSCGERYLSTQLFG